MITAIFTFDRLTDADPDAILCDSYIGDATLFVQTLKAQDYSPRMIVAKANGFTDPSRSSFPMTGSDLKTMISQASLTTGTIHMHP